MMVFYYKLIDVLLIFSVLSVNIANCKHCPLNGHCKEGTHCFACIPGGELIPECVRSAATNPFTLLNNSLPFNKYAFLTTHNAFAITGVLSHNGVPNVAPRNQEDSVAQQLNNGVRGLMLDVYDFEGDIWLCHSREGECHDVTAFRPAMDTLVEIEVFLSANPSEIVTIILEDHVQTPKGLTKILTKSGLMKYMLPLSNMPKKGQNWPLVSKMVAYNHRLLVFTSDKSKEETEMIAYQWNYMVENKYGDEGLKGECRNRVNSSALDDKTKALVLVNYFRTPQFPYIYPTKACVDNSEPLLTMVDACSVAAGQRYANFLAVDFYKMSKGSGGGAFRALDKLNGQLICGEDDVQSCKVH
ncbi:unnamed protein product [Cuscuta epithymum]|uniref:Uncharacterized protein n=1 Tax=Cuscuta epithymum TaxID=186058 RepID=A0AAV0DND8_9ASTE|nr:unnamed protein product [Cuscuta epithymum]